MHINIICQSYIDEVMATESNKGTVVETYYKSFEKSNHSLMNYYLKYFIPSEKAIIDDKIYKYYMDLMNNLKKYRYLCEYKLENEVIQRLLNYLSLPINIFNSVEINLFMGMGTCHGFVTQHRHETFVNIAIEKFIDSKEPYNAMSCIIIHELVHYIRIKNSKATWRNLGNNLIEEGLACLISKEILKLTNNETDLVFPVMIRTIDEEAQHKFINLYWNNIFREDRETITKFMHLGDKDIGIIPGLGYIIGEKLLCSYIKFRGIQLSDVAKMDNDKIISECFLAGVAYEERNL